MALILLSAAACGGNADAPATPEGDPVVVPVPETASTPLETEEEEPRESYCEAACREDGLCAILDGSCVALEDGHCAMSKACEEEGRCAARERVCVEPGTGVGIEACERVIEMMRRCMPAMPPGAGNPMEEVLRGFEKAFEIDDAAQREELARSCESIIEVLSQNPACASP